MSCSRIHRCPMFQAFSVKSALRVWQITYCEGDFARCERFKRAACGETVAPTLLPNGKSMVGSFEELGAPR